MLTPDQVRAMRGRTMDVSLNLLIEDWLVRYERCKGVCHADIQAIYESYPRHVGRQAAVKAIQRAVKMIAEVQATNEPDAAAWLRDRVTAYAASPLVRTSDRQYIPHPATWFNQARYDDDAAEWGEGQKAEPTAAELAAKDRERRK